MFRMQCGLLETTRGKYPRCGLTRQKNNTTATRAPQCTTFSWGNALGAAATGRSIASEVDRLAVRCSLTSSHPTMGSLLILVLLTPKPRWLFDHSKYNHL